MPATISSSRWGYIGGPIVEDELITRDEASILKFAQGRRGGKHHRVPAKSLHRHPCRRGVIVVEQPAHLLVCSLEAPECLRQAGSLRPRQCARQLIIFVGLLRLAATLVALELDVKIRRRLGPVRPGHQAHLRRAQVTELDGDHKPEYAGEQHRIPFAKVALRRQGPAHVEDRDVFRHQASKDAMPSRGAW
jgi:hypothetical protein